MVLWSYVCKIDGDYVCGSTTVVTPLIFFSTFLNETPERLGSLNQEVKAEINQDDSGYHNNKEDVGISPFICFVKCLTIN
jgi:hypothetical protein